jgi:hypothetical protein
MSEPAIDFTQLKFPSDSLTVATLRKVYPHSFDLSSRTGGSHRTYGRGSLNDTLGGVIDTERLVASLAFKQALRLAPNEAETQDPQETLRDLLASDYVTLGLATGQHHAEQLVRDIEGQATTQARTHPGNTR